MGCRAPGLTVKVLVGPPYCELPWAGLPATKKSPFCPLYLVSAPPYGPAFPAESMEVRLPCVLPGPFQWAEPRRRAPSPAEELYAPEP